MSNWGKGVINNIGWGQGANNNIGWGSIYDKSNAGETLLSGGGFEGFLNKFSGASLGLSLVLLVANYLGFCIRVRRSSDNTELDIGFVNGILDTASLLDFVGSGNGFVSIIYEQIAGNNFIQNTASLQGQIVSNGSVILKGEKPCILRSANDNGGYLSTYTPNDGATVKGMFYVGQNSDGLDTLFGSNVGTRDYVFSSNEGSSNTVTYSRVNISLKKINNVITTINTRGEVFNATNNQFLLYSEIEFNFRDNVLGLGYRQDNPSNFGMFTFQELVIFENTDDAVAKENNINTRYNNIY